VERKRAEFAIMPPMKLAWQGRLRILLCCGALAALAFFAAPKTASPAGRLVVHGPNRGSSLQLGVRRGHLVVNGLWTRRERGCHFRRHHRLAVCPLAGVSSIVLNMGPHGDFVRVKDRLPAPLTVHLGPGADKFMGNGEPDTCYGGGTRRNRCVGGGGNDVCITGPRNSDCVGGRGNDYCQGNTGSDGCWGGPGRDVCRMGPGKDGCHGGGGNDRLYGGAGQDKLVGGPGYDYCNGGPGRGRSHNCEAGPRR
jgi:RTX calcium-binding nonapeptide repeat (4 copies)